MQEFYSYLKPSFLILTTILVFTQQQNSQDFIDWNSPLKKCWEYKTNSLTSLNIASDNDKNIYLTNTDGSILAINVNSGKRDWKVELGGSILSKPILRGDSLTILYAQNLENTNTVSNTFYVSIEKNNGTAIQSIYIGDFNSLLSSIKSKDLFFFSIDGSVKRTSLDNILIWKKRFETQITTNPLISGELLIFGTSNKSLIFINRINGKILKQINLLDVPNGTISQDTESYFIGDKTGRVYSINKRTDKIEWITKTGGRIRSVEKIDKQLVIHSDDNFVYSLSLKNGKKVWKKKFAGRIIGKAQIDKRTAAYLSYGTDTVVILDIRNGEIINLINLDNNANFISPPIYLNEKLIIPTDIGIYTYSIKCK